MATRSNSRKTRTARNLKRRFIMPNVPDQAGRANEVRMLTET
jgi:hypothetical protein